MSTVNKKKGILAPDDGYSNIATIFDEDDLRDYWVPVDVDKPDDGQKVQVTYHGADGGIFCDRFGFYDSKTGNWTLEGLDRFLYVDVWRKIGRPYYKKN